MQALHVGLTNHDRTLLDRCLAQEPRAWEDFVDRYLGLVVHVVNQTQLLRNQRLTEQDKEDLVGDVFLTFIDRDFHVLRRFRRESCLATYLTAVARRVVVRGLARKLDQRMSSLPAGSEPYSSDLQRITDRDEVEQLIAGLNDREADVVRMYHLEGKSYHEISLTVGLPENSIGPTLSRARAKLRTVAD